MTDNTDISRGDIDTRYANWARSRRAVTLPSLLGLIDFLMAGAVRLWVRQAAAPGVPSRSEAARRQRAQRRRARQFTASLANA